MFDRTAIMKRAWQTYHYERRMGRAFDRALFAQCMRWAWAEAKRKAAAKADVASGRAAEVRAIIAAAPVLSPLEARIDALKYLPFRYDIRSMEAAIRAHA